MKKIENVDGMSWCGYHKEYHKIIEFGRNKSQSNGLSNYCKTARYDIMDAPYNIAVRVYNNIVQRCLNKDGIHPSYHDVECKMTKNEFVNWYIPERERFEKTNPDEIPSVDRLEKHYEIGKIRIISSGENSRININNKQIHAPEGMGWCYSCKEYHSLNEFYKNKTKIFGISTICKTKISNRRKEDRKNKRK